MKTKESFRLITQRSEVRILSPLPKSTTYSALKKAKSPQVSTLRGHFTLFVMIIAFLFMAADARAEYRFGQGWSWTDTGLQSFFIAALAVDAAQTMTMAKNDWWLNGKRYSESCPFLSDHPDTDEVGLWFAGTGILHTIIAAALPPEATVFEHKINPRRIWQGVWIVIEAGYAAHNHYSVGVRIKW